ncbi:MAG: hypothetical protein QJR09_05215 [Micrococcus sp.]|nr:hypothetical protein [Micrococcus sp.]
MTDPVVIAATGVVLALAAVVAWLALKLWPALRKFSRFVDDVAGEPARPGFPAVPGLMERVRSLEDRLGKVQLHVQNDHDTLLRDDVDGIRDALHAHITEAGGLMAMARDLHSHFGDGFPGRGSGEQEDNKGEG